mgnify:CR=1 FL=1
MTCVVSSVGREHLGVSDGFRDAGHALALGPIGYCGSKAAMRVLSEADVVLALGCRLGPFGTLPQYDMAYWPDGARLIQVTPSRLSSVAI